MVVIPSVRIPNRIVCLLAPDVLPSLGPQVIATLQVACKHNSRVSVRFRSPKDQRWNPAADVVIFQFNGGPFRWSESVGAIVRDPRHGPAAEFLSRIEMCFVPWPACIRNSR